MKTPVWSSKHKRNPQEIAQLNARRKEKKAKLLIGRKPSTRQEWVELGESLYNAIHSNPETDDIAGFALARGYSPLQLRTWIKDDEDYACIFRLCIALCEQRRRGKWKDYDKYLLRTFRLYDLEVAKDEDEIRAKQLEGEKGGTFILNINQVEPTQELEEHKKRQALEAPILIEEKKS